jgi:hypothetical protein
LTVNVSRSRCNVGKLRACRHFLTLIYATTVMWIGWYAWNLLLLVLLFRSRFRSIPKGAKSADFRVSI